MDEVEKTLFSSFYLWILTITAGVFVIVFVHFFRSWNQNISSYNKENDKYDDFSTCQSAGCIRCQNYKGLKHNILDRFTEYMETERRNNPDTDHLLQRVKDSIDIGLKPLDDQLINSTKENVSKLQNPNVFRIVGLPSIPWYDEHFRSEVSILEDSASIIREEYKDLLIKQNILDDFHGWLDNNVPTGMWSVFHLINQGRVIEENCTKCPKTVEILKSLGHTLMRNCAFGNVMFSILEAGTHITEHCGPCNLRVRCHLGLHVPANCCILTVAGTSREWQEGRCILFDDSFLHEARHLGPQDRGPRVVLLLDFWHPDVTEAEKKALCHTFHLK